MKKNKHSLKISRSCFGDTTLDGYPIATYSNDELKILKNLLTQVLDEVNEYIKDVAMSRNLMRMALMMAATAAYAQDDIFGCSSPRLDAPSGNIPSDKQKCQPKAQHEFIIKGVKIMAASKKDAIKKFNHRKK